MNPLQNLRHRKNNHRNWIQFDGQAKRYLNKLLVKEVLQMLPAMLLYKMRQYQKLGFALVIALFLMLLLAYENGYAQTDSAANRKKLAYEKHYPRNNVQINLSSLALKNYNFSYERSLSRKITFVAGYRYMPLSTIGIFLW